MAEELSFEPIEIIVPAEASKARIDTFLADRFEKYSRSLLRRAIQEEAVTVDGQPVKASFKLRPGQRIAVALPDLPVEGPVPENIPLDILFEDDFLIAVNKPPAMVVHPARGHWSGTLASALAFHFDQLSQVAGTTRPGIVHRLDRDTSGVIIVAKTDATHYALTSQFEARTVLKTYLTVVRGVPSRDAFVVEAAIGRHPYQREKMAVRDQDPDAKPARTVFYVEQRFDRYSLLRAEPKTGRTHQIRVHAAHAGHPVLCDRLYGGRSQITAAGLTGKPDEGETLLSRQALHAWKIAIRHPKSDELMTFEAPLPDDLQSTVQRLTDSVAQ